jgi:hypothetical protein
MNSPLRRRHHALLLVPLSLVATCSAQSPAQRRTSLLQLADRGAAAIPALSAALQDDNLVVRRTAARLLSRAGEPAAKPLREALGNSDFVVRLIALRALTHSLSAEAVPPLASALRDDSPLIRQLALAALVSMQPRTDEISKLIEAASKDEADAVRQIAAKAVWPFFKEVVSVRDRKDWDHDILVAQAIPLLKDGWRFKLDPGRDGHLSKWYEPKLDDSTWEQIAIEDTWEKAGHEYDGVAWYRGKFPLPEKPDHLAVEVRFGAVDECAWVWVNGQYVGQHDVGPEGWDQPFALDVTKEIRWGAENQLTVRVLDSKFAGGIWKPVALEVLK